MERTVNCKKLGKAAQGLAFAPYPGQLGEKIYQHISAEAWELWRAHQTMLINEYRLNALEAKSRKFLEEEMEKFLFGGGSEKPPGFTKTQNE